MVSELIFQYLNLIKKIFSVGVVLCLHNSVVLLDDALPVQDVLHEGDVAAAGPGPHVASHIVRNYQVIVT